MKIPVCQTVPIFYPITPISETIIIFTQITGVICVKVFTSDKLYH